MIANVLVFTTAPVLQIAGLTTSTPRSPCRGLLVRRAKDLQACALDQSGALRELRQNVALLRAELKLSNTAQRRGAAAPATVVGGTARTLIAFLRRVGNRRTVNYDDSRSVVLPRCSASQPSLTVPTSMSGSE